LSPSTSSLSGPLKNAYQVFPHRGIGRTVRDLETRLTEYYKRELSFQTDIVDAIAGIINAFHDSSESASSAKNFYGLPIFYQENSEPNHELHSHTARISFLNALRWTVTLPEHDTPIPSDTFPSWTWASVKASLPAHAPGALHPHLGTETVFTDIWTYKGVHITLWHQSQGPMDVSAFPAHPDDYKHFSPHFDIRTWTKDIPVDPATGLCKLTSEDYPIYDIAARRKGHVTALCTQAYNSHVAHRLVIQGLVVTETEKPGTYRRVQTFAVHPHARHFNGDGEGVEEEEEWKKEPKLMLDKDPGAEEWKRALAKGGIGPPVLGKARRNKWTERTVRLV